jgi:LysM repeat protein
MLQAPRIVRWTLPALLLTLVVGGYAIVAASGVEDQARPGSVTPVTTNAKRHKPKRVKVHTGDTAASIARRAKLTLIELLELNPKVDPRLLRPGQRLKISR